MPLSSAVFDEYLDRWALEVDGDPLVTPRAKLLPVRSAGRAAMLKIAAYPAEVTGNKVMAWWGGDPNGDGSPGAAPVLEVDGPAILMARASEPGTLVRLLDQGRDDDAMRILAGLAHALHAPRRLAPPAGLPTLEEWFTVLTSAAERLGGPLHASARAASELLRGQADRVVLHGDLHHENVLDFGADGWLAIDPKGVVGERSFDHVVHLYDPDDARVPALSVLERRLTLSAQLSGVDRARLRLWLLAWAGLAATWWSEHGGSAEPSLAVAQMLAGGESD